MVNLAFCRLDGSLSDLLWQLRSTTFIYFHLYPFQRDDHSCWNFFVDLLRTSDLVLSKLLRLFWSSAVRISFPDAISFCDLREDPGWKIVDHDSDLLDAGLVSCRIFSNNRRRLFRSGRLIFWTFWVLLIDSADSVYFCAIVLFWLEIRLITFYILCFW